MDAWRQWIRHRTANVNEYSTRYSVAIDAAHRTSPTEWRMQSTVNRQGSAQNLPIEIGNSLSFAEQKLQKEAREVYEARLTAGVVSCEQARKDLPRFPLTPKRIGKSIFTISSTSLVFGWMTMHRRKFARMRGSSERKSFQNGCRWSGMLSSTTNGTVFIFRVSKLRLLALLTPKTLLKPVSSQLSAVCLIAERTATLRAIESGRNWRLNSRCSASRRPGSPTRIDRRHLGRPYMHSANDTAQIV